MTVAMRMIHVHSMQPLDEDNESIIALAQRVQKAERELRRLRKTLAEARFHADAAGVIAECANRRVKGALG